MALSVLVLAIVASPFSVSPQQHSVVATVAEAAAPCGPSDVAVDLGNGTTQCTSPDGSSITVNNQTGVGTGATAGQATNVLHTTDCAAVTSYVVNLGTCLFRTFVTYTAATLIYLASWLLALSGVVFNWLILHTVVNFGDVYTSGVKTAVENGWTAFRDISNILIIGIFTFIAISIILGLKEFGQKKLIANVLLVAVLINFSLLGTKMVIDASNFVAGQIYTAAALGANGSTYSATGVINTGSVDTSGASAGIAGNFIYLLGVQSFPATQSALDKIAQASNNGWVALLHGAFVFVILVATALVLFYGSFLLISRVILLIFLMFSSSIAVASYIVPKWSGSRFGWDTWKTTLIKCATLAPTLMLLLWVTLNISIQIHASSQGSFGNMIADPTKTADIGTLVNYCIILGLLFISFKLANVFASKIAGFNYASMAAVLPATLGSRLAGFALRQTAGWAGFAYQKNQQTQAKDARNRATNLQTIADRHERFGNFGLAAQARAEAKRAEDLATAKLSRASLGGKVADSKFNVMNTKAAQEALKKVGVTGFAAGATSKDAKSYGGRVKADADEIEKRTKSAALSGDDERKIREQAVDTEKMARERDKKTREETRKATEANVAAIKNTADKQKEAAAAGLKGLEDDLKKREAEKTTNDIRRDTEYKSVKGVDELAVVQSRHRSEMSEEKAKIEAVKSEIEKEKVNVLGAHALIDEAFSPQIEKAKAALSTLDEEIKDLGETSEKSKAAIKDAGEKGVNRARETVQEIAGNTRYGLLRTSGERQHVKEEVKKRFKQSSEKSSLLKTIEEASTKTEDAAKAPAASGDKK